VQSSAAYAIAQTLVGRVEGIRAFRAKKTPGWKRVQQAADANRPALETHVQKAFKKALGRLGELPKDEMAIEERMSQVMETFEKNLHDGLEDLLLQTLGDGGDAAATNLMHSPLMRTSQGFYKPTLVLLRSAIAHRAMGGPGSGNFGHSGRPGEVGGSGEGEGLSSKEKELKKSAGTTTDPDKTGFILKDGTRIKKAFADNHSEVVSQVYPGVQRADGLNRIMKEEGTVRYIPRVGIEAQSVPTEAQAKVIADDFKYGKANSFTIDVATSERAAPGAGSTVPYRVITSRSFDKERISADLIRNFVKSHLDASQHVRAAAAKEVLRLLGEAC